MQLFLNASFLIFFVLNMIFIFFFLKSLYKAVKSIEKIYVLIDLLKFACSNDQVVSQIYTHLRSIPDEHFPKNGELKKEIKKVSENNFLENVKIIQEKIDNSIDKNEKIFLERKLQKINEFKNLVDIIDEDSDPEFFQTVINEIKNTADEIIEQDFEDETEI